MAKYERLPMNDPDESAIDFSSPFTYENFSTVNKKGAFTYGTENRESLNKYRSTFTYDGWDPNKSTDPQTSGMYIY